MGYVPGESLASRLRRDGRLGIAEARRIVADVADALDHAHRQGVVHRDIKPDNILIDDESGRALLADFGIAKALGAGGTMTQQGTVIGTPQFMSPEQAAGKEQVDGRSDLYSLGCVSFAVLAGRPPFESDDAREVLVKRITQEPPTLRTFRPDLPEDLSSSLMRCLAKDPAARFADARALREVVAPTGLDEDELPEPLDALDGMGPTLLPLGILWADALWYCWLTFPDSEMFGLLLAVLSGGALLYQAPWLLSAVRLARRRGFSRSQVVGAFLRQPTWWYLLWYPRRFRRPGDVWDRLPWPFRTWRIAATLALADALALSPFFVAIATDPGHVAGVDETVASWLLALAAAGLAALAFGARHVLALGLDVYQRRLVASALISGPNPQRRGRTGARCAGSWASSRRCWTGWRRASSRRAAAEPSRPTPCATCGAARAPSPIPPRPGRGGRPRPSSAPRGAPRAPGTRERARSGHPP